MRFFLGFGRVGGGGMGASSKMGLFRNGKDNWIGVFSKFFGFRRGVEFYIGNRCGASDAGGERVYGWM